MRIALAQVDTTPGDVEGNAALVRAMIGKAGAAKADCVVFPELTLTGYPPRDLLDRAWFVDRNLAALDAVAAATRGPMAAIVGFVARTGAGAVRPLANAAAVCAGGRVQAVIHKRLLPSYDVFDEDRYFEPGPPSAPVALPGGKVGITICEDLWTSAPWRSRSYQADPAADLAAAGAEVVVNLSASPFHRGKPAWRGEMLAAHATRHRIPFAMSNLVGANDDLLFDGASTAVGPDGTILARGACFAEDLVCFETRPIRAGDVRPLPEDLPAVWDALVMGVRGYARKCGFSRAVLGVSGGIDSSVVACLAADALGGANVHALAMPGPFSSPESLRDARALAEALGMPFEVVPITTMYEAGVGALRPLFGNRAFDVTEENVQARLRCLVIMAVSNKLGALPLATSDKSETAVGFTTLYGDMGGGLAPIADVWKTDVYRLARWRNTVRTVIPAHAIERPPSPELRPDQRASDTLPPYAVLDPIARAFVEEGRSPEAIVASGADPAVVRRVVALIERAEFKRRQGPPPLRVSPRAFGIGRRVPIARGPLAP